MTNRELYTRDGKNIIVLSQEFRISYDNQAMPTSDRL